MKTLSGIVDDCKRKFRQEIGYLFDILVRKYDASTLISFVPTHDGVTIARLKALRKVQNRKMKKKLELAKTKKKAKSSEPETAAFEAKRRPKT